MNKSIKLIFAFLLLFSSTITAQTLGIDRVNMLKTSLVRILVEGEPSGTGFFVTSDGWIATCWHVIEPGIKRDSTNAIIGLKKITAQLNGGEVLEIFPSTFLLDQGYISAISADYCMLKPNNLPKTKFNSLVIGDFNTVSEGDEIYTGGYPMRIEQQFISKGILSSKWIDKKTLYRPQRADSLINVNVAWLDLTMNKGNSGGPVIKIGRSANEDRVIGIATFILNPYANDAAILVDKLSKSQVNIKMGEVDINETNSLYAKAIANNSIGISGCVSINHLNAVLKQETH